MPALLTILKAACYLSIALLYLFAHRVRPHRRERLIGLAYLILVLVLSLKPMIAPDVPGDSAVSEAMGLVA